MIKKLVPGSLYKVTENNRLAFNFGNKKSGYVPSGCFLMAVSSGIYPNRNSF